MIDLRFQYYFFSNWVDGLNPNPEIYKENKANDWLVWFNVGYIYYLLANENLEIKISQFLSQ
jgi:hypothetical protein